jgi:subtilase family serine protease
VGAWRGVPDLSFDADPYTGVWVYDTYPYFGYTYQWWTVGGTSVAAPSLAGIINRAGAFAGFSSAELTTIYDNKGTAAYFTHIAYGFCGAYMGFSTATGGTSPYFWDFCTGVGVPNGYTGK